MILSINLFQVKMLCIVSEAGPVVVLRLASVACAASLDDVTANIAVIVVG